MYRVYLFIGGVRQTQEGEFATFKEACRFLDEAGQPGDIERFVEGFGWCVCLDDEAQAEEDMEYNFDNYGEYAHEMEEEHPSRA